MRVIRDSAKGAMIGRVLGRLRRFRRNEDGSMIIFTLFLLIMMLMIGGLAVDLMRFETNRARLQATLDRAVLAAADLEQTLNPEQVVRDYFFKAGLLDQLHSVVVTQTINSRSVSARASINVNMMFMDMLGIEQLEAPAAGVARETVTDIEIALVLDISGSMASNSKIQNLRIAASNFVQTMLAGDVNNKISISIVPFNAQVNIGAPLRSLYNVTDLHGIANSNCIDLPIPAILPFPSVFAGPGISTNVPMPQSGYFDAVTTTTRNSSYITPQAPDFAGDTAPTCKVTANNVVRLATNSVSTLQSYISGSPGLTAQGNTSITLGMKWGLALLDPGSRPIYTSLIGTGNISSNFAGRPYDYNRANTLKIIIVMTDGEHVASYLLNSPYRVGNSPIYRGTDNNYSIRQSLPVPVGATAPPVGMPFYVPHLSVWQWRAWTGTSPGAVPLQCANNDDSATDPDGRGACTTRVQTGATVQTWPMVWQNLRMHWVAWQLYARGLSSTSGTRTTLADAAMDRFFDPSISATAMDTQLQATCGQARANGVIVFGIAFEAPAGGQTQIRNCSSSSSHFYIANGAQIDEAFYAIANTIQTLRLMQ